MTDLNKDIYKPDALKFCNVLKVSKVRKLSNKIGKNK